MITIFILSFLLGIKHAFDADHIALISVVASGTKSLKKSLFIGIFWGLGHATALLIVGFVVLNFKINISENIIFFFELVVGGVLIVLGFNVLRKIIKEKIHFHYHQHREITHIHFHQHKKSFSHNHVHKSFFIGMIHGLAGSGAVMLLVLTTIESLFNGLIYIFVFGLGSILGMLIITMAIGFPFTLNIKSDKFYSIIMVIIGIISIIVGSNIIYDLRFVMWA